ncbi:MAG: aminodeoxychorismate/anthranilate synthase component II [Candidatus Zixiibacteriota bacterium]
MVFVLDNYDSFTFNLVQYFSTLGVEVKVALNDQVSIEDVQRVSPSAIVLSPGPGRPENAGIMNALIRTLAGSCPILGVCLGHQAIAQVYGSTIVYASAIMHGKVSTVRHDNSRLYQGVANPFSATRYHSLAVDRKTLAPELRITAWSDDGTIMGIEHLTMPVFGVQYHPESIMTPDGMTILQNFCKIAASHRAGTAA